MPRRARPGRGDFDDESVAVQVEEVGACAACVERGARSARACCSVSSRSSARRVRRLAACAAGARPGLPASGTAARPCAGSCATNVTSIAARVRPGAELGRQQRIGRLIRRQVRRDVADAHAAVRPWRGRRTATSREPVAVLGERHRLGAEVLRGEGQHAAEPVEERVELALRAVVRTAADDGLARVKEQVQNRRAAADDLARRARSCPRPSCTTDAASARARRAAAAARACVVYGHGARAVPALDHAGHAAVERGRDRQLEHVARARRASRRRRRGSTASSGAPTKSGPPLVRFVEQRRDATNRPGSPRVRATRRAPPKSRTGPSDTTPAARRPRRRSPPSATPAARRTASSGSDSAYGCRSTSSGSNGGVSHA